MSRYALFLALAFTPSSRADYVAKIGEWSGEPRGLEDVRITRYKLTIDMRELDGSRRIVPDQPLFVHVESVYHIFFPGDGKTVDLSFHASEEALIASVEARLNGEPLRLGDCTVTEFSDLTESSAPQLDATSRGPYRSREGRRIKLSVTLPQGNSVLRISYPVLPGAGGIFREPTRYWMFSHGLQHASRWRDFGGMDLAVLVPPGWRTACEPALRRDGDMLTGSFDAVPAESIAITTQFLTPEMERRSRLNLLASYVSIPVLCIVLLVLARLGAQWSAEDYLSAEARKLRIRSSFVLTGFVGLLTSCIWGSYLIKAPAFGIDVPRSQRNMLYYYTDSPFTVINWVLLSCFVGVCVSWLLTRFAVWWIATPRDEPQVQTGK